MSKFQVQVGIPMVKSNRGRKPTDFPLGDLVVGASFRMDCDIESKKEVESWRRKFRVSAERFNEKLEAKHKYTTALVREMDEVVDDNGEPTGEQIEVTGVRVWRTE